MYGPMPGRSDTSACEPFTPSPDNLFSLVFEHCPDIMLIVRQNDGVILEANHALTCQTDLSVQDAIGQPLAQIDLWLSSGTEPDLLRHPSQGSIRNLKILLRGKDGHYLHSLLSAGPVATHSQAPLLIRIHDIGTPLPTRQLAALTPANNPPDYPEALRAARNIQDVLSRNEKLQLAAIAFEHSAEAMLITDANQCILAVNRVFSTVTGYSAQQALGQTPRLFTSSQHDSAFYAAMWHRLNAEGHWQGEVCNRRHNGDTWPCWLSISAVRDLAGELTHFIAVLANISSLKHAQAHLDHQAHHDPLTSLPNRTLFETRLRQALQHSQETGSRGAVLFLDLDRFKQINDRFGHDVGDLLLKAFAQRLKEQLRDIDTVARLGGDEFVILLPGLLQASDAPSIAQKLLASLSQPLQAGEHPLIVSTSIGSSLFPDDATDVATLIKHADTAMYRSKSKGRNRVEPYTHDLSVHIRERIALEQALHKALEREQLSLHFQPLLSLPDLRLAGAEVLLRWQHPEFGQIPTERIIALAEENGSIVPIGDWVLETACRQLQAWRQQHPDFGPLSINLSSAQLRQPHLPERILQLLTRHRLSPGSLQLEITEQCVMNQPEHTLNVLHNLKRLGIRLAIDDFGTGYSSLGYLKRLPLDTLKIDRAFIRGLPDAPHESAVVRAIIALANSLQLNIIAEGVETLEQQYWLAEEGCQYLQGHLISTALPAGQFEERILLTHLSDYSDGTADQASL